MLTDATARAEAARMSSSAGVPWTLAEVDSVTDELVRLSAALIPLVVDDVVVSDSDMQAYVLAATIDDLESWLTRAAASMRRASGAGALKSKEGKTLLPLRSATQNELRGIRGVGPAIAVALARAASIGPHISSIEHFEQLRGVGPGLMAELRNASYLDRPMVTMVSAASVAFMERPSVGSFVTLLESSDTELLFGDANRLALHPPVGGTVVARLLQLVRVATNAASNRRSVASAVFASDARTFLERRAKLEALRASATPGDGEVLVNGAYSEGMIGRISAAVTSVDVMMFLATATSAGTSDVGSLAMVEALEERSAAGVTVRVILDRDRPDDPYRSTEINASVVARLTAAGIAAKSDTEPVLLHSKMVVIDGSTAAVGSHNITRASFNDTHELSVVFDGQAAAAFQARFNSVWASLP